MTKSITTNTISEFTINFSIQFLFNKNQISFNKLMNTQNIDDLRNLASYLRTAFQRREKVINTSAIAIEYLPSVSNVSEL